MTRVISSKDLRSLFLEQAKCLDLKLDIDCSVLVELNEFFRRRAFVEQEYADALNKLVNGMKQRHISETSKRPHWVPYTTTTIWNTLLGSTLRIAEAHSALSELFTKQMVQRLVDMDEDAVRLHKQCREMMTACQERVLANSAKLQSDQRDYANKQLATLDAERQRRRAEDKMLVAAQKARSKGKDPNSSQRFLRAQTELEGKNAAYASSSFATARARNDYLIQLAAVNQSVARYFSEEAPDIIDCFACGFHNSLARSAMMYLSCEEALKTCHGSIVEILNRNITALDWRQDKACFLKCNEHSFTRPGTFTFLSAKEDNESQLCVEGKLRAQLEEKAQQLSAEIDLLRVSTEETWKTLEEVEKRLLELINQKDYDVSRLFISEPSRRRRSLGASSTNNGSSGLGTSVGSLGTVGSASSSSSPIAARGGSPNTAAEAPGSPVARSQSTNSSLPGASGPSDDNSGALYLRLRSAYRDARIEQERFYLDRFAHYTEEMHKCQVLQVQLSEIRRALAADPLHSQNISPTPIAGALRYGRQVLPVNTSACSMSSSPFTLDDATYSPPPPPPAPEQRRTTNLTRSKVILTGNPVDSRSSTHNIDLRTTASHPTTLVHKPPTTRRVLRVPNVGKPKLFGGTIDEYVEATNQPIPCILLSCTRVIVKFGMQQQGIFRVSGSQTEINDFKVAFEHDEDPLTDVCDARDINSTAGLLKLYFRELGEPPFPNSIFLSLISCARESSDVDETARRLRHVVTQGLSRPVFVVMRFLFAFLNHVSEHADENSMDAYNLAICFGPSLMPVPSDLNQVQYQTSVIDLLKTFITHHAVIFDPMIPGPVYVKHGITDGSTPSRGSRSSASLTKRIESPVTKHRDTLQLTCVQRMASEVAETAARWYGSDREQRTNARNPDTNHRSKSPTRWGSVGASCPADRSSSLDDTVDAPSKEEYNSGDDLHSISDSEVSEPPYILAVAQSDFSGSTRRELSFQQGDELHLYRKLNDHWWDGQLASDPAGVRGLVPHLYVTPKTAISTYLNDTTEDEQLDDGQLGHLNHNSADNEGSKESVMDDDEEEEEGADDDDDRSADEPVGSGEIFAADKIDVHGRPSPCDSPQSSHVKPSRDISVTHVRSQPDASLSESFPRASGDMQDGANLASTMSANALEDGDYPSALPRRQMLSAAVTPTSSAPVTLRSPSVRHVLNLPSRSLGAVPENEAATTGYSTLQASPPHKSTPSGDGDSHVRFFSNADIDNQLAEFMRNLSSIEQADTQETGLRTLERNRELRRKLQLPCAKHTPDLVMDLPRSDALTPPIPDAADPQSSNQSSFDSSSADNFAEQSLDTMRKRPEPRYTTFSNPPTSAGLPTSLTPQGPKSDQTTEAPVPNSRFLDDRPGSSSQPLEPDTRITPIAARVAAFEATASQSDTSLGRTFPRPPLAPKPRRT
ncbi:unnamed protein product [Dicrocoelium dendriticum]|nr:unnamed protein product [Dicrocoelium dendriticum]